MIESQLTETAAPGEGKAAARVANQRRQDTAPDLESKAKLLPSDRLRPQAEEAGRQLIRQPQPALGDRTGRQLLDEDPGELLARLQVLEGGGDA